MTMVQLMMPSLLVNNPFYPSVWHDDDTVTLSTWTSSSGDGMSTGCCLNMPSYYYSSSILPHYRERTNEDLEENYSIISNSHSLLSMHSNNLTLPGRLSHQQLLFVTEEVEPSEIDNLNGNDKLLLPRSTRSLKRRTSLLEKSRDWARRLMALRRIRRNTTSHERIREACSEIHHSKFLARKSSQHEPLSQKRFDEDGYLSPLEIKAQLDNIARENNEVRQQHHQSLSKLSNNPPPPPEQLLLYSHSSSDVSQLVYRCHGSVNQSIPCKCICQPPARIPTTSFASEFHKSLSIVDYIDFDVPDESTDDDPLDGLKFLFDDDQKQQSQPQQQTNSSRRTPRRSTNTSSISTDSGYCDMPMNSSSISTKLIPVHLISCTLIPVNVATTTPDTIDLRCVTCTCPPTLPSSSASCTYSTATVDRRRRKSSSSYPHPILMRTSTHMDLIENGMVHNRCSCNNKYYSTMTICPSVSTPVTTTTIDEKKEECYNKHQRRHVKKKRASLIRFPSLTDDLTSISRWYRPHLQREAVCSALQQADYGAFILRNSSTHSDCYALSLKVPRYTHESNIAHYLIEKSRHTNENISFRIKGTMKQFPTLLSLITHHSVMPEILPITLNLSASIAI